MKKFNLFLIAFVSVFCFSTITVKAETPIVLESAYYKIKPSLNTNLLVNPSLVLDTIDDHFRHFNFHYIPAKHAYVINASAGAERSLKWTGELGSRNLKWAVPDIEDDSMLWTLEQTGENEYIIANKKDPSMVFDVDNYDAVPGNRIKLEKQHEANSPYTPAQVFVIERV